MNFSKKRVALFLVAIFPITLLLTACDPKPLLDLQEYRGFRFEVLEAEDGRGRAVAITAYFGDAVDIAIPTHIRGMPVTEIWGISGGSTRIERVHIPDSVTVITYSGFFGHSLTEVTIPKNITVIYHWVFAHNLLKNVAISDNVTEIGQGAFAVNEIKDLTIGGNVAVIDRNAFRRNRLKSVAIPDSVSFIGTWAFRENDITEITIGSSVFLEGYDFNWPTLPYVFPHGFDDFYREHGSRAGTFTFDGYRWHAEFRE